MPHSLLFLTAYFFLFTVKIDGQGFRILHWGIEEGLSQGINQKIIRDSKGFLWITSYEGVNRFDGKTFHNFYSSVKKNSIRGIETTGLVEDSLNKIWIGSGDGLNRYDPVTDSVISFLPDHTSQKKNRYSIPLAAWKDEVICFEISGKVVAYNNIRFTKRLITDDISWYSDYVNATNCWLDKKNNLLWMPAENGLVNINLISGKTAYYFKTVRVNALLYDEDKSSLIIGTDVGLMKWDLKSYSPLPVSIIPSVSMGKIISLAKDKDERLWIGTQEYGLIIMNQDHSFVQYLKTNDQLNSINGNRINSIFCDRNGIGWIGVSTNGIDQLIPSTGFTHYAKTSDRKNSLPKNIVRCFMEDDAKNIWIATQGGGISIFNPYSRNFTSVNPKNLSKLPFDFVRFMIRENNNTAFIGTEKGAYRINLRTFHTTRILFYDVHHKRLTDPYIEQIISFENDSWLFASKEFGLFRLNKSATAAIQLSYPGNRHVYYIAFINGFLFVLIWDDDPKIFSIKNGQWKELTKELTSFIITDVQYEAQKKKYWIGTLQGLIETDEHLNIIRQYTMADGLSNHYIYALAQDNNDMLWISTNKGISQLNMSAKTFRVFTPADGLQGFEYNAKAAFKASDSSIYFGGTNGFDIIRNSQPPPQSEPAIFYIKELLVNNLPFNSGNNINYTSAIHLPYSGNNITIQTGVIDFITRGNNKIKYKLEGVDEDWRITDRDFTINYSGLPPGEYTFIATAANADNEWTSDNTSLNISIAKPWWQSWWLRIGVIGLLAGIATILIRSYYQRKLLKQKADFEKRQAIEHERTRIATDMHDDLGAGLSRIKFLSENMELKTGQQQAIGEEISKIRNYSHEMIDKMGEIVWALNKKNDSLTDLLSYTRAYAVEYLGQYDINCHIDAPQEVSSIFVSGEFRRNIYLSVKEALHNIVKHAEATEVTIRFKISRQLEIFIEDNGKGIDLEAKKPYRNGLINMRERLAAINGRAEITNRNGTTVCFSAPLTS